MKFFYLPHFLQIHINFIIISKIAAIADESVSILFADVAHFSILSNSYPPQVLVSILDGIYSTFDGMCYDL